MCVCVSVSVCVCVSVSVFEGGGLAPLHHYSYRFDYPATIMRYVWVSCHRPFFLLLSKDGRGFFNVCNHLSACGSHAGETGTDESAQVLTRKN